MKTGTFIGIDFGTTNTAVVAVISNEYGSKKIFLGEEGEYPFSSVVAIPKNGENMLFGREVKRRRLELSKDYNIITSMKSYLGTNEEFIINNRRYTAVQITAEFLRYIKVYVQKHYNIEINEATFAFPIDFSPEARKALKSAADLANININGFVSESTAAYIATKNEAKAYSKVMVIDWGGGTLDISILDLKGNYIYENSVYGDKIGGDDIDLEIAKRVHSKLINKTNIKVNFDEMRLEDKDKIISQCENVKIGFSNCFDDADILLRNYGEFGTKSITIEYEYFEEIIAPIIKNRVLKTIDIALERAQVTRSSIDAVIIAGGSCDLRPFANLIINVFGQDKIIIPDKKQWEVAVGAAYIDIIGSKYLLNDDLGVLLSDNSIFPILKKSVHGVGSEVGPFSFSLTEDSKDAHFIFTNGDNTFNYSKLSIPTKGFLEEKLEISASITSDQIAQVQVANRFMGKDYSKTVSINKLKFYYDLSPVKDI